MILILMAWLYVVLMMSLSEALAPQGSVAGAAMTFVVYGTVPLALLVYLLAATARQRTRLTAARGPYASRSGTAEQADAGRHPAGDPLAPEGKEP